MSGEFYKGLMSADMKDELPCPACCERAVRAGRDNTFTFRIHGTVVSFAPHSFSNRARRSVKRSKGAASPLRSHSGCKAHVI